MKKHEKTSTTVYRKIQLISYENDGQPQNPSIKPVISLSIVINFRLLTKSKVNELYLLKTIIWSKASNSDFQFKYM